MTTNQPLRFSVAASMGLAAVLFAPFSMVFCAGGLNAAAATNSKTTPVIHWGTPAHVTYGAALNGNILNAWVSGAVPGTFVYSPVAGTVLGAGTQTLSVTFTPTDTADYTTAMTTVQLAVKKAVLVVGAFNFDPATYGSYGDPLPPLRYSIKNFVNGDTLSVVSGVPVVTTTAVRGSPVGQYPITPTIGTLAAANYSFTFVPGTLTITPAPLFVTAYNDGPLPYGDAIPPLHCSITGFRNGDTQSIVSGAPSVTTAAVLGSAPGNYPITPTLGTLAAPNYTFQFKAGTLTIVKATPKINWATPGAISYGTALGSGQLNATAHVPGAFVYTPAAGTVPLAGADTLSVIFAPTNTADYAIATATVQLTVNKAVPAITWPTPAAITYGTALSSTQLDATSTVAGAFAYTPAAGSMLLAGAQTLSVTFTPTDTADYASNTGTAQLTVNKATPAITWPAPASIAFGTALSATQLDATSNVAGRFVYFPAIGTVLNPGNRTLTVTLTPTDTSNYTTATASVQLTVTGTLPPTTTTLELISSGEPVDTVESGSVVTLTATVKAGSVPVTPGTVTFCNAAAAHCTDIHIIGTAQLTDEGTAASKFRPGVGNHSYKAVFGGTGTIPASSSSAAALTVTGIPPSAATLAMSGAKGDYTLTATVGGNGGTAPTGTVSFIDTSNGNAVVATANVGAGAKGLSFLNSSNPVIEGTPENVAIADYNGDGIPDMAIGNLGTGDVTILLGNGDGTFKAASSLAAGAGFDVIAAGDFTGNGIQDIEITTYDGDLGIFLGNGDGTFGPVSWPVNLHHLGVVALGDFNQDGILDIAVSNYNGCCAAPGVNILLGKGDGTFAAAPEAAPSSYVLDMVEGDFNGDGIPDLAITNFGNETVEIWLGNGDGTFTQKSSISPGVWAWAQALAVADLNGDGELDVAVVDSYNDTVTILVGDGTGKLTQLPNSPKTGAYPDSIAVGDFNGDGIPDLAVVTNIASGKDGEAAILLGNGDGTFTPAAVRPPIGVTPQGFGDYGTHNATADFNGDGVSDLVVVNAPAGTLTDLLAVNQTASATATGVSVPGTGTHQIVASYSGDSNYRPSVSASVKVGAGSGAAPAGTNPQH